MLLQQRDADPPDARDLPARRRHLPSDQSKQRCLTGAIATDDAPLLPSRDRDRHVAQEHRRAELDADTSERQLRHEAGARMRGADPALPGRLVEANHELVLPSHQRHAQQQRLLGQPLQPTLIRVARRCEAQLRESLAAPIDQRTRTELLREALQLTQ